jgi:hypothetical protein
MVQSGFQGDGDVLLLVLLLQERREDLVRQLLDDLHSVCSDIGEDVKAAAAEAHPSLVYIW